MADGTSERPIVMRRPVAAAFNGKAETVVCDDGSVFALVEDRRGGGLTWSALPPIPGSLAAWEAADAAAAPRWLFNWNNPDRQTLAACARHAEMLAVVGYHDDDLDRLPAGHGRTPHSCAVCAAMRRQGTEAQATREEARFLLAREREVREAREAAEKGGAA